MDFETSLGLLTAIVALGIAAWAAWTAQQTLKRNAAPQLECFLRPRPSNTVFDFVIINTGSGSAYNVGWKIDADEQDFKAHVLNPRHTALKGSTVQRHRTRRMPDDFVRVWSVSP